MSSSSATPVAVVQQQLEAYNAKDVDRLLATYADSAELYEFPDKLLARGSAELRARFAQRFQEPDLHATLLHRIVAGEFITDHEHVTRNFPEGPGSLELTMIYQVQNARIVRAWSIIGPKRLT